MKNRNKTLVFSLVLLLTTSLFLRAQQKSIREDNTEENFLKFIEHFNVNTQFQLERSVFPLKARFFQDFDLEPLDTIIRKGDFYHQQLSFKENCSYKIVQKNQNGELNNEFRTYEILGKDNGICISYTFKLINSKWYLIHVSDMSS